MHWTDQETLKYVATYSTSTVDKKAQDDENEDPLREVHRTCDYQDSYQPIERRLPWTEETGIRQTRPRGPNG